MNIVFLMVDGKFSQRENYNTSLDIPRVIEVLRESEISASKAELKDCIASGFIPDADYVVVGGYPDSEAQKVLEDFCLTYCHDKLIPSYELLSAYENKGLQGLIANKYGLPFQSQAYYYKTDFHNLMYPYVIKTADGAGSSGVRLIASKIDLWKFYLRSLEIKFSVPRISKAIKFFFANKLLLNRDFSKSRYKLKKLHLRHVVQEFASNLSFDYKVIVFGDIIYVLKRSVRKGDFRASGSGLFSHQDPPDELLTFAMSAFKALCCPYVSLDIICYDGIYKIIEFQSIHFGPITQMKSEHFYQINSESRWIKRNNDLTLEECYAYGIAWHIKKNLK